MRESRIAGAGEGLFAVRDIGAGETVAYFAGVRLPATETSSRSDYSILMGKYDINKDDLEFTIYLIYIPFPYVDDGETALDVPTHLRSTQVF